MLSTKLILTLSAIAALALSTHAHPTPDLESHPTAIVGTAPATSFAAATPSLLVPGPLTNTTLATPETPVPTVPAQFQGPQGGRKVYRTEICDTSEHCEDVRAPWNVCISLTTPLYVQCCLEGTQSFSTCSDIYFYCSGPRIKKVTVWHPATCKLLAYVPSSLFSLGTYDIDLLCLTSIGLRTA